jgi:Flp pilus assembly protein TadG
MFGTTRNTRNFGQKARAAKTLNQCKAALNRFKSIARVYTRDEDGALLIFGIFTFVIVLVLAGIGVDIARHETLRTELQNTLDRAVLAAANRETSSGAREVVEDYFAKAGLTEYLDEITVEGIGFGKKVTATVTADIPTYFLRLSGVDNLELNSIGAAEQGMTELEVALVLDVSGSMNSSSRLSNLSIAGRKFAETVFSNSTEGHVAVSVIPYATQVNVGPTIASQMLLNEPHDTSHCVNFTTDDYKTSTIDWASDSNPKHYDQTVHFDPFYNANPNSGTILDVCSTRDGNTVLPFSTSLSEVTDKISGLYADGNTSIDVGVKWGAALLDPTSQSMTEELIKKGLDESNAGRPHDYTTATLKVMVVMTDGVNTTQYDMPDPYRSGLSDIYVDTTNNRVSFLTNYSCGYRNRYTCSGYYAPYNENYYSAPYGGWDDTRLLEWPEVWARFTTKSHANVRKDASGNSNDYNTWYYATRSYVSSYTKNLRLQDACQAAKDKGIIIFTIGFEAPSSADSVLQTCASSTAHYSDADGLEVADAFAAVATKITELRLVE